MYLVRRVRRRSDSLDCRCLNYKSHNVIFNQPILDWAETNLKRTIEFVYVLGTASANHNPMPLANPGPSALIRSLTIRPSSRATTTLSNVRAMRKDVCSARMPTSLDLQCRNPKRRTAHSCLKNTLSTEVFLDSRDGTRGKSFAALRSVEALVGSM